LGKSEDYMFVGPLIMINDEQLKEAFKAIDKALHIGDGYLE